MDWGRARRHLGLTKPRSPSGLTFGAGKIRKSMCPPRRLTQRRPLRRMPRSLNSSPRSVRVSSCLHKRLGNKQLQKTKEQIHKMYERYYNKWRDYDLLTSILSILGLVVAIVDVTLFHLTIITFRESSFCHHSRLSQMIPTLIT